MPDAASVTATLDDRTELTALRENEERLRLILENTLDSLWDWNLSTDQVYLGPGWTQLAGRPAESILASMSIWEAWIHPDDRADVGKARQDHLRGETAHCEIAYRLQTIDGQWRWVRERGRVVARTAEGQPSRMVGVCTDVTALHESEAKNGALLRAIPDMMFRNRRDGLYLDYHAPASSLLAAPPEIFLGRHVNEVLPADIAAESMRHIAAALNTGEAQVYEYPLALENQTRYFEARMVPVGPDEVLTIVRDITARRMAEHIQRLQHDLALALATTTKLQEALNQFLQATLQIEGVDAGGTYLVSEHGDLVLTNTIGLPENFVKSAARYEADSPQTRLVMQGQPIYVLYDELKVPRDQIRIREGLRAIAILPVCHEERVIACLNLSSHRYNDFPTHTRHALETLTALVGGVIARLATEAALRESQRNLQTLFDSIDDFLFILDDAGRIMQTNPTVIRRLGYSLTELQSMNVLDVHPPERRQEAADIVAAMLRGDSISCPIPLLRRDGQRIPVDTKVSLGQWGSRPVIFGISRDVTARLEAEAARRDSEERYRSLVAALDAGIVLRDAKGRIIASNPASERITGVSHTDYQGHTNLGEVGIQTIHPDGSPFPGQDHPALRTLHTGQPCANEVMGIHRPDGNLTWISINTQPLFKPGETHPYAVVTSFNDITERRKTEAALAHRDAILEAVSYAAEHFLSAADWQTEIQAVLRELGQATESSRVYLFQNHAGPDGALLTDQRYEWTAPGIAPQIENPDLQNFPLSLVPRWVSLFQAGQRVHGPIKDFPANEREILEPQGIRSLIAIPIHVGDAWWGFAGFDDCATEREWSAAEGEALEAAGHTLGAAIQREQMEAALRQSERRNTAILDAIPDLIFRMTRLGVIIDFRTGHDQELYRTRGEILNQSVDQLLPPPVGQLALIHIARALDKNQAQTFAYQLPMPAGLQHYEARIVVSGVDEVLAVIRNVTEQVRLEQMKSDFINLAAHELRTPLATTMLMADLIHEGGSADELSEYWNIMQAEFRRQRALIEQLLTVGRLESGNLHLNLGPLQLLGVIEEATRATEALARARSIQIQRKLAPDLPMVMGDTNHLQQALVNLLSNAIKFSPENSRVMIQAEVQNNGVAVEVVDHGIGIPPEDLPHLFERFFRATNATQNEIPGTGIGLYLVKSIAEQCGGRVHLSSQLGQGTQVRLWLPLLALVNEDGTLQSPNPASATLA